MVPGVSAEWYLERYPDPELWTKLDRFSNSWSFLILICFTTVGNL